MTWLDPPQEAGPLPNPGRFRHLLAHGGTYQDLGAVYYTRREEDPEALAAKLKRKIESLGYTVELSPAA